MVRTQTLTNVSGQVLPLILAEGVFGEMRVPYVLGVGQSVNVNTLTPEIEAALAEGKLTMSGAGGPITTPRSGIVTTRVYGNDLIPELKGSAFTPQQPRQPVDFLGEVTTSARGNQLHVGFTGKRDIDWWNCDRGPYWRVPQALVADFMVEFQVLSRGGLSRTPSPDWAGAVILSANDQTKYARVSMIRRIYASAAPADRFEWLFVRGIDPKDPNLEADGKVTSAGKIEDWNTVPEKHLVLMDEADRKLRDGTDFASFMLSRKGKVLTLTVRDGTVTHTRRMANFIEGPVLVGAALGRYPSAKSTFQGAVFSDFVVQA